MWWLWLMGCTVADGDLWSRDDPGWDQEGCDYWEPAPVDEGEELQCQREATLEITDWDQGSGELSGTWDAGPHGAGTVEATWVRLDPTFRRAIGTWSAEDGRGGEVELLLVEDDGPWVWGWAMGEGERAMVYGPAWLDDDGVVRGEVAWSFFEAYLEGWIVPEGMWLGRGSWNGGLMYVEGEWAPVDERSVELVGATFYGQWARYTYGSFTVEDELVGTMGFWVDGWGFFDGVANLVDEQSATFQVLGYPEGC